MTKGARSCIANLMQITAFHTKVYVVRHVACVCGKSSLRSVMGYEYSLSCSVSKRFSFFFEPGVLHLRVDVKQKIKNVRPNSAHLPDPDSSLDFLGRVLWRFRILIRLSSVRLEYRSGTAGQNYLFGLATRDCGYRVCEKSIIRIYF